MDGSNLEIPNTEDRSSNKKKKAVRRRKRDKEPRVADAATAGPSDGGLAARAALRRDVRYGASYKEFQIGDKARAHVGDSYSEIKIASVTNLQMQSDCVPGQSEEAETVRLAAAALVIATFITVVHFLKMLRRLMSQVALPKQLTRRIAHLEDALGSSLVVDIDIMDWTYLHYRITCAFSGRPGHNRVARASYRLFDQARGDLIINPKRAPSFEWFFRSGRHYRMSIHFDSTEVSHDKCPKCSFTQKCHVGSETVCVRCEFSYRGHVEDRRVEELGDDTETGDNGSSAVYGRALPDWRSARRAFTRRKRDEPGQFKRISISKEKNCRSEDLSDMEVQTEQPMSDKHDNTSTYTDGGAQTTSATQQPLDERVVPSPTPVPVLPQDPQRPPNRGIQGSASYNQFGVYTQNPPVGINPVDYFTVKENRHDHLYKQYQFLQAQQDALRAQLAAQQQPHVVPRFTPPLPDYMHQTPISLEQDFLRRNRNQQRKPETVLFSGSTRRQSQPSRSSIHPLLKHQLAQQGYDVDALGLGGGDSGYGSQKTDSSPNDSDVPVIPHIPRNQRGDADPMVPQEYVGYYVGEPLVLRPHQDTAASKVTGSDQRNPIIVNGSGQLPQPRHAVNGPRFSRMQ